MGLCSWSQSAAGKKGLLPTMNRPRTIFDRTQGKETWTTHPQTISQVNALSSQSGWPTVIILMLIYASSMIDRQVLGLVTDLLRHDLNLSDVQVGLLAGPAFVLLHVITLLPFGYIVDRWNRRRLVAIGVSVWSLMTISCGLARTFPVLAAARAGVGIGEATLTPAAYSLLADRFPPSGLSKALSVYALGLPLGGAIALLGGGWAIGKLTAYGPVALGILGVLQPWQALFVIVAIPGFPLAMLLMICTSEPTRTQKGIADGVPSLALVTGHLWRHRGLYQAPFVGGALLAVFSYGISYWLPVTLQRIYGFSTASSGFFIGGSMLVFSIPGTLFAGWLADRLRSNGQADGELVVGLIYGVGLFICLGLGPVARPVWLSLALMSGGMFFLNTWVTGVAPALLQRVTPSGMRGRISALYVLASALIGLGLGPPLVAFLTEHFFGGSQSVGKSLAVVATVAVVPACAMMQAGRRHLRSFRM